MFTVCITERNFGYGEVTLRLTSELVDLRVGYAKWIRRTEFAEPHLRSSVNMMQYICFFRKIYFLLYRIFKNIRATHIAILL